MAVYPVRCAVEGGRVSDHEVPTAEAGEVGPELMTSPDHGYVAWVRVRMERALEVGDEGDAGHGQSIARARAERPARSPGRPRPARRALARSTTTPVPVGADPAPERRPIASFAMRAASGSPAATAATSPAERAPIRPSRGDV